MRSKRGGLALRRPGPKRPQGRRDERVWRVASCIDRMPSGSLRCRALEQATGGVESIILVLTPYPPSSVTHTQSARTSIPL